VRGGTSDPHCVVAKLRRGRADQAFEFGEPGRTGWGHRQFTRSRPPRAATGWPGRQDEAPHGKLLAGSGSGPGVNASPLFKEPAAWTALHHGSAGSRVGWTSLPCTPIAAHFNG